MHIYAPTSAVILLIAIPDRKNVLRFPTSGHRLPGLHLASQPRIAINEQLQAYAREYLDSSLQIEIVQEFIETFDFDGEHRALYLGTGKGLVADQEWFSMPEILRSLPKSRHRLAYLKAWQVLSGGLQAETKVIENADLKDYLPDS